MYDGIIFDIDGTIWDSTNVVEKAWNDAFKELGYEKRTTAAELKGLFGLPMDEIFKSLVPDAAKEDTEVFEPLCSRYEFEYLEKNGGIVYPGVKETIEKLSENHILAIVSNCQAGYIELVMRKTGIEPFIKDHLCPDDSGLLKAGNIKLIAERLNMKNPVYVGDIAKDEIASREAGVAFIHAAYGFGEGIEPDYTINSFAELLDIPEIMK
ncbi:MAG: HAD family hydrolase [Lachnospiraceae bacterium]|nr:HAD family hydrolase [Lachnospiraceae bacterium]